MPPVAPPPPIVTALTDARVLVFEVAVQVALLSGPYTPEYAVPEGTPCTLVITDPTGERLKLEKADTKRPDAASELVKLLVAAPR